jgi:hypothetical protein
MLFLDMQNFVTNHGAQFVIGMQLWNDELDQFYTRFGIPHVDLTTTNRLDRFPGYGNHWTPAGHTVVAERLERFLMK